MSCKKRKPKHFLLSKAYENCNRIQTKISIKKKGFFSSIFDDKKLTLHNKSTNRMK